MNHVEQIIWDHLAAATDGRPYIEVGDLLSEDEPFIKELADEILELMWEGK